MRSVSEAEADLQAELWQAQMVIRALVHRAGGQVSIPRHELESAPSRLTSFVTPDKGTVMLSTWEKPT